MALDPEWQQKRVDKLFHEEGLREEINLAPKKAKCYQKFQQLKKEQIFYLLKIWVKNTSRIALLLKNCSIRI